MHTIASHQHFVPIAEDDPFGLAAAQAPGEVRVETAWVAVEGGPTGPANGNGAGGRQSAAFAEEEED